MTDPIDITPNQGKVSCHDGSPFINIQCSVCGFIMHVHATQLPADYHPHELRTFCKRCATELWLPPITDWTGDKNVRLAKPKPK